MKSWSADVSAWCRESKERMHSVRAAAIQELVEELQAPGNVPIDTGFMRASFTAVRGVVRLPPKKRPTGRVEIGWDSTPLLSVLVNTPVEDPVTLGWGANYARHVEYGSRGRPGRAFMRLALQRWPQIVAEQAALAYRRNRGAER